MTDTVAVTPETFTAQEPASVPDRTITYPLRNGSVLAHACPAWCIADHEGDLDGLLMPEDLRHEGKAAALEFDTIESSRERILDARIVQYPFAGDGSEQPHMELMPEASSGESTGYLSASEFNAEIRRAQRHLTSLLHLSEQLAEARAVAHERFVAPGRLTGKGQPWLSIDNGDVETMPVDYLLRVFGVKVFEVDDDDRPADQLAVLSGEPGAMTLSFKRCVPQVMREQLTRVELLKTRGASRD
ncbi:DUF6907 domain-containing protein [Streptomyces mirabilis]|uniref:DUF2470 domain-containing protein n=1 Tax=Streptomyces mirabilis TaxID=68239 RepID=A0ABU3UWB9_9ACTN|nr:hypothetical protein [Streptomyces mirabilis]MDU8998226.1 hypothetical protein [Streptomyces mirabilis]